MEVMLSRNGLSINGCNASRNGLPVNGSNTK